jgi:hypothetical protein
MRRVALVLAAAVVASGCWGSDDADADGIPAETPYVFGISAARIQATNGGLAWDPDDGSPPDVYAWFAYEADDLNASIGYLESYTPTWTGMNGYRSVLVTAGQLRSGLFTVQLLDLDPITATNPTWDGNDAVTAPRVVRLTDDQIRAGAIVITAWDRAESATFFVAPAE